MSDMFWLSPVPPAHTDIAQYSARLVPHLAQLIDLNVVRPDHMEEGDILPSREIGSITTRERNNSRLCFYNIGNNPVFHESILRICLLHPGVVILHDRSLQDLCYAMLNRIRNGDDEVGSYQATMFRWYGRSGREAAQAVLAGEVRISELGKEFPLFEVALENALGTITHNPEIAAEVSERFPGMPILLLNLPYDRRTSPVSAVPALSRNYPIRLVMFGYLGINRRLCDFLRIWARSPWKDRFELDLAGEMNNGPEVSAVIAETGLSAQIRNHGFLPDAQLDALISQSHLALNLRNPTMGEASGSQLRIWANGAASVVSNAGWYSQLPEGSALRIGVGSEEDDLLALLKNLSEEKVDLAGIAERGNECLTAHDPVTYAKSLAQWIEREREAMFVQWTETRLIQTIARSYARCIPSRFVPKLPKSLLA